MSFNKWLIRFVILLLIINIAYAQDAREERFKLADTYEKSGDYKSAVRLYSELNEEFPDNDDYFQAVLRSYKALNQFSELLPIIEKRIKLKPESSTFATYGEILWRTGKTNEAGKAWEKAVELEPRFDDTYLSIANAQISLRLFDKAVATLEQGRSALGNDLMFSDQLSQLYIATGNYEKGTEEVLNLFEQTNNISIVQGRLSAMMNNPDAVNYVNRVLQSKASDDNINYKKVYAWFLRSNKRYEDAFEVYKQLDKINGSNGSEILNFANSSRADDQIDAALKAYEYIIDMGKKNPNILNALYGYARTLEAKLRKDDNIAPERVEDIIERYRNIVDEFSTTPTAEDARIRIATLYYRELGNYEKAITELQNILNKENRRPVSAAAYNMLGEIYTMQDKLDEAEKAFHSVVAKYSKIAPDEKLLANYRLAELKYFQGLSDTAKEMFAEVSSSTNSDYSNDALDKITLLEQNKELIKAISTYAQAELRERQKRYDESVRLFMEASGLSEGTALGEECIIRSAQIEFKRKNFDQARQAISTLLEKNPETLNGDFAYNFIGDTYYAQANNDMAIKYYTDLLAKYPKSIYLDEARAKIKNIRAGSRM